MISMRAAQKFISTSSVRRCVKKNSPRSLLIPTTTTTKALLSTAAVVADSNSRNTVQQHKQGNSSLLSSRSMVTTSVAISVPKLDPVSSGVDLSLDQLSTTLAGGDFVKLIKQDNPFLSVIQYTHKNVFYNISHVDYYSEALACGYMENGLIPGDVMLTFLPSHLCETMMLQFCCSKSGLVLYNIDPDIAIDDPSKAKEILKEALNLTKANILISFETANDVNYIRLVQSVVPELRFFDWNIGMIFISPRFPDLRICNHTGMDQMQKWGWLPLHHMVVPSDNLNEHIDLKLIHNNTPLAGQFEYDGDGIPIALGPTLTNAEVFEKKHWPTYCKILERQFHVVEGLGVVF